MKRKIGFIGLAAVVLGVILFIIGMVNFDFRTCMLSALVYAGGLITAIVCLIGDVIRFIGKCFSQGFSAGNSQECSQVCPLCGKAISGNACFCSECGCELTKNS